jgi:hypothetical protein
MHPLSTYTCEEIQRVCAGMPINHRSTKEDHWWVAKGGVHGGKRIIYPDYTSGNSEIPRHICMVDTTLQSYAVSCWLHHELLDLRQNDVAQLESMLEAYYHPILTSKSPRLDNIDP